MPNKGYNGQMTLLRRADARREAEAPSPGPVNGFSPEWTGHYGDEQVTWQYGLKASIWLTLVGLVCGGVFFIAMTLVTR